MTAQLIHEGTQVTTTQPTVSTDAGRLHKAWQQIRSTVAEINYTSRRVVELQAPWAVDDQSHTR